MQTILKPYKILAIFVCVLWTSWCAVNTNFQTQYIRHFETQHLTQSASTESAGSLWSTIGNEFQLDHEENSPAVQKEIHKLLADQKHLYSILQAASPYIYFINKQIEMRRMPGELSLIPFIESEFNPNDHSSKGAAGLWQLMPQTASGLGVKVKSHYDGRRNVVSSTLAALTYFNSLGHLFKGDWYLAIAAYNCGEGKVQSAERHSGEQNFWNLHLPQETRVYVPKLLAIAAIIKNPERYGVKLPDVSDHPFFGAVELKKAMTLEQFSNATGIDLDSLKKLNPDFAKQNNPTSTLIMPLAKVEEARSLLVATVN